MNDKIIINLIGGVGNQMFQYALGYAISKRTGFPLYIDLSSFKEYKARNYELEKFNCELNIVSREDCDKLNKKHFFEKTLYKDKKKTFNPDVLNVNHSVYLKGFWQSEKYFLDIREDILNIFSFKNYDFIKNQALLDEIKASNSISVNLRLGDYINNETIKKEHFVCRKKYYKNALTYIASHIESPVFYVFSDDLELAKKYLPKGFDYKFANTDNWQEDLYFMQNAKHNIVANSSFSWWAAWLNRNPDKIVVAPDRWFTSSAKICDKDHVPDDWVRVPVN